jgi:hypothetical protein
MAKKIFDGIDPKYKKHLWSLTYLSL